MEPYFTVALCFSPKGERFLKACFDLYTIDHPDQAEEIRKGLYEPLGFQDMEIHRKDGSVLRTWARIQWSSDQPLPRFLRRVCHELEHEAFALCQFGHEPPSSIAMMGKFDSNPFALVVERCFHFMDADGKFRTSCARYYTIPESGRAVSAQDGPI
jgi:hypothetical protein